MPPLPECRTVASYTPANAS